MKRFNLFLAFTLFFLYSCQKDKWELYVCEEPHNNVSNTVCQDFVWPSGPSLIFDFYTGHEQFMQPALNPNNPNEFVYFHSYVESGIFELVKYNLQTKQKTILTSVQGIINRPRWGKSGWIVYDDGDYHIRMVREEGNEVKQLSNKTANIGPYWNEDGRTLYWHYSPNLSTNFCTYSYDLHSGNLDTLTLLSLPLNGDIKNDKFLYRSVLGDDVYIGYFNLKNAVILDNFIPFGIFSNSLLSMCWSHTGEDVYAACYKDGLYKINVATGTSQKLMDFCDTKRYNHISCTSDGKYLVGERTDSYQDFSKAYVMETSSIYYIELATMKEIKICLD